MIDTTGPGRWRSVSPGRIRMLNEARITHGDYVFYWMQASQRIADNPALSLAVEVANDCRLPVLVGFGIDPGYPEANGRHFRFMVEGLTEVAEACDACGAGFLLVPGNPAQVALRLSRNAAAVVCDRGYLRHQREWRATVARDSGRWTAEVEGDVVVPVAIVSDEREYAARTIRPKIHRALRSLPDLEKELTTAGSSGSAKARAAGSASPPEIALRFPPESLRELGRSVGSIPADDVSAIVASLPIRRGPPEVSAYFRGGHREANRRLDHFVADRLAFYDSQRGDPSNDASSGLSPYLHFGQISPIRIAATILERIFASAGTPLQTANDKFLDELIVRRELAINFVNFEPRYDSFDSLPEWSRRTLAKHRGDPRPVLYSTEELEEARTGDRYWNAAAREMRLTGYMQNTMRMYWGKKILEWSETPEVAYERIVALNNRYFLDGRDPSSYANVGWIFGLHDRPWAERPIFGTVRYMAASGLERKYRISNYVANVDRLPG